MELLSSQRRTASHPHFYILVYVWLPGKSKASLSSAETGQGGRVGWVGEGRGPDALLPHRGSGTACFTPDTMGLH